MSGRIVNFETSAHQAIQELLPWFVTDRLEGGELEAVREHLAACPQCRADADWQRRLRAAEPDVLAMPDADGAWARMQSRLDEAEAASPGPRSVARNGTVLESLRRRLPANGSWMPWALAAQLFLIAGLGVLVAHLEGEASAYREASFHVLGTPKAVSGNVMVMFRPGTTEQDMRAALRAGDVRVVDGPTMTGAWLLHADDARLALAVTALRAQSSVALAEPLTSGAAP